MDADRDQVDGFGFGRRSSRWPAVSMVVVLVSASVGAVRLWRARPATAPAGVDTQAVARPASQPSLAPVEGSFPMPPSPAPVDGRAVVVARLIELAPELSPSSANVLLREVPAASISDVGLAELGLVLARRGFERMERPDVQEVGRLFEQVYGALAAADRRWMSDYMEMLRNGTLTEEQRARGRRLLTAGIRSLPEPAHARLQYLMEKALVAGLEEQRAERRAREAQMAPPLPVEKVRETPVVAVPVVNPVPPPSPASSSVGGASQDDRGESYWRSRMESARARVRELQAAVAELDAKATQSAYGEAAPDCVLHRDPTLADQNDYYECLRRRQNWGVTQQAKRQDLMSRLAKAREALAGAQLALSNLEEEARRAGALPGWLR